MPYIRKEMRDPLDNGHAPINSGELNYLITRNLDAYIAKHGLSYDTLNAIVGVLECAKMELYRRVAAPYEDSKLQDNGDVYTARGATQIAPPAAEPEPVVAVPADNLMDIRAYDHGMFLDRYFEVDFRTLGGSGAVFDTSRHSRLYSAFCDYMRCLKQDRTPLLRMVSLGGTIQASSLLDVRSLLYSIGVRPPADLVAAIG